MLEQKRTNKKTVATTAAKRKGATPKAMPISYRTDAEETQIIYRQNELWDVALTSLCDTIPPCADQQLLYFVMLCWHDGIPIYDIMEYLVFKLRKKTLAVMRELCFIYTYLDENGTRFAVSKE